MRVWLVLLCPVVVPLGVWRWLVVVGVEVEVEVVMRRGEEGMRKLAEGMRRWGGRRRVVRRKKRGRREELLVR